MLCGVIERTATPHINCSNVEEEGWSLKTVRYTGFLHEQKTLISCPFLLKYWIKMFSCIRYLPKRTAILVFFFPLLPLLHFFISFSFTVLFIRLSIRKQKITLRVSLIIIEINFESYSIHNFCDLNERATLKNV